MIRQHRESLRFDRLLPVEGNESDVSFKLKTAPAGSTARSNFFFSETKRSHFYVTQYIATCARFPGLFRAPARTRRVFFWLGQSELETRAFDYEPPTRNKSLRFLPHKTHEDASRTTLRIIYTRPSGGSRHSLPHPPPSPTHIQPPQWPPSAP